jgi:hypothetical protein
MPEGGLKPMPGVLASNINGGSKRNADARPDEASPGQ